MRTRRGVTDDNNQVGSVYSSLHTDIIDPLERLMAVTQSTAEAKESGEKSPLVDVLKIAGAFSPAVTKAAAGIWSRNQLSSLLPVNISTVVTNVNGARFSPLLLWRQDGRLLRSWCVDARHGPVSRSFQLRRQGHSFGIWVIAPSCQNPELYHTCLVESYEALYAAATHAAGKGATKKKGKVDASRRARAGGIKTETETETETENESQSQSQNQN